MENVEENSKKAQLGKCREENHGKQTQSPDSQLQDSLAPHLSFVQELHSFFRSVCLASSSTRHYDDDLNDGHLSKHNYDPH